MRAPYRRVRFGTFYLSQKVLSDWSAQNFAYRKRCITYLGFSGTGTFDQSGGSHTITAGNVFYIGFNSGSNGETLS